MKERCLDRNHLHYANYGGRGISICARWLEGFENFLADMGSKPSPKHSLDRRENDRGYEPENCRWATRTEQNVNTRKARRIVRSDGAIYPSLWHAAKSVGARSSSAIANACDGRSKTSFGFGWKYADVGNQLFKFRRGSIA